MKKWIRAELDKAKVKEISQKYDLPVFTAMLLVIRGITDEKNIENFFDNSGTLADPFGIKDMDKAAERIRTAVMKGEKICVYGDYDCDGVTSAALLYSYLQSVSADVVCYIPDRNSEGYGMNIGAVDKLKEQGVELIVTVDNGISAADEISYAGRLGIDVVVTDHHKPRDILPNAAAVVDPHRLDDTSGFKDYCGAGLALMLAAALEGDDFIINENYSDLAAFGTIADLVPLCGENRRIVKAGLVHLKNSERQGMVSLIEESQIDKVNAGNVAFRLAPRINAAGRLGSPYDAFELLLTEDENAAREIAESLSALNTERQSIESRIFIDIVEMLEKDPELSYYRVLVVSGEGWNPGVIGIAASKVTEKYGKPCIIISEDGDVCKASARSIPGFSIVDAIFACSELLEKFGGHPMAAGLSIKREKIDDFRKMINDYADALPEMPLMPVKIDCNLNPDTIVIDMVHQLQAFEPFGYGNPKPVFGLTNMRLEKIIPLSGGKHLKLMVSRGSSRLSVMYFSVTPEEFPYPEGSMLDFAVSIDINIYQQKEYLSITAKEISPSGFDTEKAMREIQLYEQYLRGKICPELSDKYPAREEFAAVYLYIKKNPLRLYTIDSILTSLRPVQPGAFKLLAILDILRELKLINYSRSADVLSVSVCSGAAKVDLQNSLIYKKLKEDKDYAGKKS